jgi:hypothetical protein
MPAVAHDDEYPLGRRVAPRDYADRYGQLTELGFDARTAMRLADLEHVSIHEARRLIKGGCPIGTAVRILE